MQVVAIELIWAASIECQTIHYINFPYIEFFNTAIEEFDNDACLHYSWLHAGRWQYQHTQSENWPVLWEAWKK